MEVSLKALSGYADLLPNINLQRPGALLGRDTVASMNSGIVYGYSFLVEGILGRLSKQLKLKPQIVATGGCAPLMAHYCRSITKVDNTLTLKGLRMIYKKRKKRLDKLGAIR